MSYYKLKRQAFFMIDDLVRRNEFTKDEILFKVEVATGLGQRMLNKYIESSIKFGKFVLKEGVLIYG